MRLFKVKITRTICVVADDNQQAIKLANKWKDADDCDDEDCYVAKEVLNKDDIPPNWKDCVPYCNARHNLTMEETLEHISASTKSG